MTDFKEKYFKYKLKYLNLKGGGLNTNFNNTVASQIELNTNNDLFMKEEIQRDGLQELKVSILTKLKNREYQFHKIYDIRMYILELQNTNNINLLPQLNDLGTYYNHFLTSGGDNTTYKIVIIIRDDITMELPETLPRELPDIFDSRYGSIKFNYNSIYGEKIDYLKLLELLESVQMRGAKVYATLNQDVLNIIRKEPDDFLKVYEEWADYKNINVTSKTISSAITKYGNDNERLMNALSNTIYK